MTSKLINFHVSMRQHIHQLLQLQAARPFSCATCDKAFANRAALSIHERRTHGADPAKMFYCGKCSRGYGNTLSD